MVFANILVPTDFSCSSAEAYKFALDFANKNTKLHLIHVLEPLIYTEKINDYKGEKNFERERVLSAEEEMERFINKFFNAGIEICRTIISGKPFEEIIKYAKKENIDLLIMATHGKTNLYHLLAGSVTKKILKFSEIPTLCIKTNVPSFHRQRAGGENLAENWVG